MKQNNDSKMSLTSFGIKKKQKDEDLFFKFVVNQIFWLSLNPQEIKKEIRQNIVNKYIR